MDRSLKSATFLIVMVSLVLGGSVNSLAQRFGFESGEGRPGRGGRDPGMEEGRGSHEPNPEATQFWNDVLRMGVDSLRQGMEQPKMHPPMPGHYEPWYEPSYPAPQPFPTIRPYPPRVTQPQPNRIYTPQPNRVYTPPPPNEIEVPVEVQKNSGFSLTGRGFTPAVLQTWKEHVKKQNEKAVAEIRDLIPGKAAQALQKLDEIAAKAQRGALRTEDLEALAAAMKSHLPASMARTANLRFYRLMVLSRLTAMLNTAVPGGGPVPPGNQVLMALMPGLPRGMIIVLGNGAVWIGVGDLCQYIAIGYGNCAQAAGMIVGIGPSLPESSAGPFTGGTLLGNAADSEVHYNINNHPFSIKPNYTQTLPGGKVWVVVFDRGGSFGQAKYTLSEGTYKFTLTEKGWDLFKHSFNMAIDNGENPFEFRYVVNNELQALAPGEAHEHSDIYPLIVRFDNGRGETKTKKLEGGVYKVGVTQENTLDLYAEDAVAPPSIAPPPGTDAPPPSPPTVASNGATPPAPPSAVATTSGLAKSPTGSLFGNQGDWRPSLFVSDVPEIAYFEEPGSEGGPTGDPSVPLPFGTSS